MKVILLAPGLNRVTRGYERFALELAGELRKAGLDATCWGTSAASGVEELPVPGRDDLLKAALERLRDDKRFASFPASLLQDWSVYTEDQLFAVPAALRIQQLLDAGERVLVYAKWQGGLVDASGAATDLLKRLATASRADKARLVVHTDYIYPPIDSMVRQAGGTLHAISPWVAEPLAQMGVLKSDMLELPMCITASAYENCRRHRDEVRREYGIPEDAFVLFSVGAFDITTPDKRYGHLLQEILSLREAERVWWVVAGARGPVPAQWEEEARKRLGARFIPLANVAFETMPRLYGMADLFALASLDETFGLVFIEAQVAGLPVVIHDCPVSRYLCRDLPPEKLNISLVDMRRPGPAGTAIGRWRDLLTDHKQKDAVRSSLDQFATAQGRRFGWETIGPRYAEAFLELMRPSRSSPKQQEKRGTGAGIVTGTWDTQSYQQGVRLFKEGKPSEALPFLGKALGGRENSERWNDWAAVQTALKNFAEAEQGFRRALALDPKYAQAAANLGGLLASMDRAAEAIPLLEQFRASIDPSQKALVTSLLGNCRAKQKSARCPGNRELEAYLRRFLGPEEEEGYRFNQDVTYYLAILNSISAGSPGQRLLGVGPGARYLVPAFSQLKGYNDIHWCAPGAEGSSDGWQGIPPVVSSEGGQQLQVNIDRFSLEQGPWPYESGSLDAIVFSQTIETLSTEPMHVLSEINRVLKLHGQLFLSAPNIASARSIHAILRGRNPYVDGRFRPDAGKSSEFHIREYTSGEIEHLATAAGFEVLQLHTHDIYWEPPARVFPALAASGCPVGSRGDTILLLARKKSPVCDRFPANLYDLSRALPPGPCSPREAAESTEMPVVSVPREHSAPMRILVVHENLPRADQSGAEYRFLQVLRELRNQGHAVTYLAPRGFEKEKYAAALTALGIELYLDDADVLRVEGVEISPDWTLQEVLRHGQFDLALFYLWFWMCISIPEHYLDEIRRFSPRTRIAVLTDDCHGLRELRGADLSRAWSDRERAEDYREREAEIFNRADIVLAVSDDDRKRLLEDSPQLEIGLLPNVVEAGTPGPGFDEREGLMYLADYNNPASRDGVDWYLKHVAPIVRQALPDLKVYLVGSGMPADLAANEPNTVRVGFVPDLATELAKHRILISPVRYGTGTKTKNLHALAHGVPVITTTVGAEGMDLQHGRTALIADDAEAFAAEVVKLYSDQALWKTLSELGCSHILEKFPHERMASLLREMLDRARQMRPKRYESDHAWSMRLIDRFFPEVLTHQPPQDRTSLRCLAYVRTAENLLAAGNRAEARRQLRHVFSYVPSRVPRNVFFNVFRSSVESMERTYRALGEAEGAADFRREVGTFAPETFPDAKVAAESTVPAITRAGAANAQDNERGEKIDLSVVIPTFNRRDTLAECLEALKRQSLSPRRFEVIVIDDGSTDDTESFCRSFQARYEFRYLRQANAGAGAARRLGVEHAQGKYLVLFNDDTIASPSLLSKHRQTHREHAHEKVAVLGDFRSPEGARARALTHFLSIEPFLFPQVTLEAGEHSKNAYFIASNLSVRRDAVLAAGSFDPQFRIAEDTELGVRLRQNGFHILYVPEARAIHQHLSFTVRDLVRRADAYGRTQLLLFRKHPGLLGDGTGLFGMLDEATIQKMRTFIAEHRQEIEGATRGLEKFDDVDFTAFFSKSSGQRTAADEVMEAFKRGLPVVFWFHVFEGFLAAWAAEGHPASMESPQEMPVEAGR